MNVERDLQELGLAVRRRDHGANGPEGRCDCPLCPATPADVRPKEPALGVNLESGLWRCHRCGEHGNLFQLRRRLRGEPARVVRAARPKAAAPGRVIAVTLVERMHEALFAAEGAAALRYFTETRKLSEASIRRFKLGFTRRSGGNAIAIPYFDGERCIGLKYRLAAGDRKYEREAGCVLPLFNLDALDGEYRTAIVTEGEFDAIALSQYELGVPVVSIPDGATATLKDDAAEALVAFDEILIAFDEDEKGEEGARKLAERLGAFRCRRVRLPAKDANDCLVAGVSREDIQAALVAASPCGSSAVKHISAWRETLLAEDPAESRGLPTGWMGLDHLLGGLRGGEVTLLTAETGAGKTTWTLDLARRQAANDHAVLVASLEIPTRAVSRKLLSSVAGKRWDTLSPEERTGAVGALCALPVFLLDRYGEVDVPRLREEVAYAVRRHGVTLAVIDHLHFALGVRRQGEDERLLIDGAAQAIQTIALELGIHVLLVVHPAKIRADANGKARLPEIGDLKGSSGPAQFADNVFRIARMAEQARSILTILKVRSELGRPGSIAFAFDASSLRFTEVDSPALAEKRAERTHDRRMASAGEKED